MSAHLIVFIYARNTNSMKLLMIHPFTINFMGVFLDGGVHVPVLTPYSTTYVCS